MPRRPKLEMTLQRDRLRLMRERRGYSHQDLADKSGLSRRQIIRYEKGDSEATAAGVALLAKALECSADYLLGLTNEPGAITPDIPPDALRLARQFADLPKPLRDAIKAILRSQTNGGNGK